MLILKSILLFILTKMTKNNPHIAFWSQFCWCELKLLYLIGYWLADGSMALNGDDHSEEHTGGDRHVSYSLGHVEQGVSYTTRPENLTI